MDLTFVEGLFVCFVLGVCMLAGYGLVTIFGLMVVKVWDRRKRKHKWRVVGRCL